MTLLLPLLMLTGRGPTITITFPPTPISKALTMLSVASGRNLTAAPAMGDEVLMARLKDAPVDAVMTHIAEVLCAKWDERPDGITWLVPDAKAAKALDRAEEAENARHLKNSLKYLRKRLAQQPEELDVNGIKAYLARKDADERRRKAAEASKDYDHMFVTPQSWEESPAWRFAARTVLTMDPKALLAMPNNAREVWAENPTAMQHAFGEDAQQALKVYRRELAILQPNEMAKRIKVDILKWESGSACSARLETTDESGKIIDRVSVRMNDDSEAMKTPYKERHHVEPKQGELPIELPQDALEARKAVSNQYKEKDRWAILEKWRPKLLDPIRYEPEAWGYGEDMILAAEGSDRNLIGTVHDLLPGNFWKPEKLTASQMIARHEADLLPSNDGFLLFRSHERIQRASRSKAKVLIDESVRRGGISVDVAADWASQSTDRWPFVNWVGDYLHVLLSTGGPYSSQATTMGDLDLRFWASLGPGNREKLHRGETLQLSSLPQESKTQIAKLVYWYRAIDGDRVETTDALPNGINDGTISLTVKEMSVFYGWSEREGPPTVPTPLDASVFGMYLAKGNDWNEIPAGFYRQIDRFKVGLHRDYSLHLTINPGALPMTIEMGETFFDPNGEVLTELPRTLKDSVEQARLAALAEPKEVPKKSVIPPG